MVTELLYFLDSYRQEFDATVSDVDGERVALDRSAFYPTGGGQPHDLGWLTPADGESLAVREVRRVGDRVWHAVPGHALAPGAAVHGRIDWTRRHQLMRTHTALHILSAVIWRDHAVQVTGGGMEPLRGRLDFELATLRADFAAAVEAAVNAEIAADHPIEVRVLPRAEAERIPDLIRTKVNLLPNDLTEIRTVHIVGLDLQADGGTHVRSTREVGVVHVVDYRSKGKSNKRIAIAIEAA